MTEPSGDLDRALAGRVIALPEARQLDVLANLVEKRGATVLRCPLVGIRDASDQAPVIAWIKRRISMPSDDLIIFYTGEGIERLMAAARRAGIEGDFHGALRRTRKLTRGPQTETGAAQARSRGGARGARADHRRASSAH